MKASTREPSQPQITTTPSTKPTTSAEDEALKKNTDCVYFLASVLTCKKGNDCEYRHSKEARMNPRDCYYWLHGNCLNPNCSFRHPPLDGLVGAAAPPPVKAPIPPSLPVASTQLSAPTASGFNPVKQATPCYYFQFGTCLKGERCAFMHGPQPADHIATQPPVPKISTSIPEPQTFKKPVWSLEKCNPQKNFRQENVIKQTEPPVTVKPPVKVVAPPLENGTTTQKSSQPIPSNPVSRTQWGRGQAQPLEDRNFRNVKEPEEFLSESSPGFDVLVEDDMVEADYYEEDDFTRSKGHNGRHLNGANETEYARSTARGFDSYDRMQDRYPREQRKTSSERVSDRPRALPRVESPEHIDELDLRYRLSKQRRNNGSRSVISPDFYRRDDRDRDRDRDRGRHVDDPRDQRYQSHNRRDRDRDSARHESSISNRLQGRISLPGRSSPDRAEMEMDRGRKYPRLSPGRPPLSSTISGRPLRRRSEDEFDFAAPKRLMELKKGGRRFDSHQEFEGSTSFEGPKPLTEILKRKRQVVEEVQEDRSEKDEISEKQSVINGGLNEEEEEEEEGLIPEENRPEAEPETEMEPEREEMIHINNNGEEEVESEADYEMEEDGNLQEEYEDDDEEDEDENDFEKKIGVMFS